MCFNVIIYYISYTEQQQKDNGGLIYLKKA